MREKLPEGTDMKIVGPWVAVEVIQRTRTESGTLILPWKRGQEPTFAGLVLGISEELGETPFEVGDLLLVESQCGNPASASEEPAWLRGDGRLMAGRTHATHLDAALLGGTPGRPMGLVPWHPNGQAVLTTDEESARRVQAIGKIVAWEQKRRSDFGQEPDPENLAIMQRHKQWIETSRELRVGHERTQLIKPTHDPAEGRGILCTLGDVEELLRGGFDIEHITQLVA